ncbi:hypothetical protein BEP19_09395 [Ammoniphilus oxalaticus]|uniref:Glycosyl transferase family 28 C-terminal domain-containing protein n=1 Tax=Ammoniphilus oxalaticus TaxID=66863 RepID=A0A419SKP3_9BACL|nr:glycosyltransferase [Ammoniphilus oxalaticus]RKD24581.1 hypothetical protein BEP19_09395 [Ammoniphilus oxalaticus]
MISYVVGRNFGHLSRCVPNVRYLKKKGKRVTVYSFGGVHRWLRSNLGSSATKLRPCSGKQIKGVHRKRLLRSRLIVHDWRKEMKPLKSIPKKRRPIICGIYHSDLKIRKSDSKRAIKFKKEVIRDANQTTDVFFHMTLGQPSYIPKMKGTRYVPIPLIVRPISQSAQKVKRKLGLKPNERFILVQMGGGKGKYRYQHINQWYKRIDRLKTKHRIVIAGQLNRGKGYSFKNKRIIKAPLFPNGRDLINAAHIVISKPGMGVLTDCIASKTPLLMLPADSRERVVKNDMLRRLIGSNMCILRNGMSTRQLQKRINKVDKNRKRYTRAYSKVRVNGAQVIGKALLQLYKKKPTHVKKLYPRLLKVTPYSVKKR